MSTAPKAFTKKTSRGVKDPTDLVDKFNHARKVRDRILEEAAKVKTHRAHHKSSTPQNSQMTELVLSFTVDKVALQEDLDLLRDLVKPLKEHFALTPKQKDAATNRAEAELDRAHTELLKSYEKSCKDCGCYPAPPCMPFLAWLPCFHKRTQRF